MRRKLLLGYGVLGVSVFFVGCVVTTERPADSAPPAPAVAATPAPAPDPAATVAPAATAVPVSTPEGPPPKPPMRKPGSVTNTSTNGGN